MLEYIQYMDKSILFNYIEELYSRNTIVDDTTNEIINIYKARPDLGKMRETYVQYKRRKFIKKNPQHLDSFKPKISKQTKINLITQYIENDFTPKEFTEWKQNFTENINPITQNEKHEIRQKMNGITMGSDGFFPFYDNIDVANKYGISNIIQPGGSIRDECVIDRCNQYNMTMSMTGIRTFYH